MNSIDKQFLEYRPKLYTKILFWTMYNKELTEDLLQEVYIKVREQVAKGNYKEEGKFTGWVVWIAKNMLIDYKRRQARKGIYTINHEDFNFIFSSQMEEGNNIEEEIISEESAEWLALLVEKTLEKMPEDIRRVFVLRIWENKSFKEIVEANSASLGTNLARMSYAKKYFKRELEQLKIA